jgi:hypothetical protein
MPAQHIRQPERGPTSDGSDHVKSQQFQQFDARGSCFPALAFILLAKFAPVGFTQFRQCLRPTCLLDFAVHGFDTKLAFDRPGERKKKSQSLEPDG